MFKSIEKDFIKMDVARYNIEWIYLVTLNTPKQARYLKNFLYNIQKTKFATMILYDGGDELKLRAYMYIFPNKNSYDQFQKENQYTDFEL